MPYTAPVVTQAAGTGIKSADWNTYVRDNLAFLVGPPACRAYNSVAITINDATETALTFDSERFDTDNMHSTSSNTGRITINTAGIYVVTGCALFTAGNDYARIYSVIRLNGTATNIGYGPTVPHNDVSATPTTFVTAIYKLAVNDYIELMVFADNTANVNTRQVTVAGNASPEFAAAWIGTG